MSRNTFPEPQPDIASYTYEQILLPVLETTFLDQRLALAV